MPVFVPLLLYEPNISEDFLFEKYKGEDHVLFSRSAAAGVQKYSCQFGGDQLSSFRGLTYAMNGGLTLAASGFLLAMHKIYKQTLHIDCKPMALLGSLHGNA